ncbi:protein kinase [Roseibacillus persicicus]|uniref:serine/threonine protein kinase n=1 Tax=Roseibacillus persicicus TaxID=454148 RepID=UPI00398AA199
MSDERYEIRGKIGQGGVGAVYRAFDRNLNREVAIKRVLTEEGFDPKNSEDEATKALLKEATALCSVQHPHIVTVYDAGVDDDGPYVVMELLSGRTLDEMVERGTMTWPDFRETAIQSLEALIAAQELDLVHRDIKPSNVMVTWLPSGKFQVKLVDFGLAKFSAKPSLQTIDHGDAVFGSIHFMAPEQFERIHLDQRTDIYSLGCVFFFCLTGQYPFDGETAPMVMAAHLQNTFTPLQTYRPDLPDWVCQWVEWHIARQPDDRPRDAREALERFLAFEQPVSQTAPVAVQAVSAASLQSPMSPQPIDPNLPPSRLTGPVPLHAVASMQASQPEVAPVPAPQGVRLITGAPIPANEVPTRTDAGNSAAPGPVVPQPITPPEGAKPSVETGAQMVRELTGPVPVHATSPISDSPPFQQPGAAQSVPQTSSLDPTMSDSPQVNIPKKGSQNNGIKVAIAAVLLVAIVFATIFLIDAAGNSKKKEELQGLMNLAADPTTREIPITEENLEGFLAAAASIDFDTEKGAVYQTLYLSKASDGTDIDRRIAEFAATEKISEQIRSKLFQVLGKRGNESSIPFLVKYASEGGDENSVVAAIDATGENLSSRYLTDFYKIIANSKSANVRSAAERAIKRHLVSQTSNTAAAKDLLKAFENTLEPTVREAYLRLLGATGTEEAEEAVEIALNSEENTLKVSGYAALANWRDDSMFERHFSALQSENTRFLRTHAFDSMIAFLKGGADFDEDSEEKMWTQLSKDLRDEREKKEFISTLARGSEDWAIALIEPFTTDENERTSFLAEKALEAMERRK